MSSHLIPCPELIAQCTNEKYKIWARTGGYFYTTLSQTQGIYHLMNFWGRRARFILITCTTFFSHYFVLNLPKSMEKFNRHSILKFHSLIIHCEEISGFNWKFVKFHFNCLQELRGKQQRNFSCLLSPFHLWF